MSNNLSIGEVITTNEHRDAIHIAVAPVEAGEWLTPGHHVRLAASGKAVAAQHSEAIGIVDPFLKNHVTIGERFWLFLYPGSITALRHDWTHPAFEALETSPPQPVMNASERWLRNFAEQNDLTYNRLMSAADDWVESEERFVGGSEMEGKYVPDEFWPHYENIRGKTILDKQRRSFFSCSC